MLNIEKFIEEVHKNALVHGWYDEERTFGDIIALIHSELSEAFEFHRDQNNPKYERLFGKVDYMHHYSSEDGNVCVEQYYPYLKPDGLLVELADVVIRVFDYIGYLGKGKEFEEILVEKHKFNETRPYKHGGKEV